MGWARMTKMQAQMPDKMWQLPLSSRDKMRVVQKEDLGPKASWQVSIIPLTNQHTMCAGSIQCGLLRS